MAMTAGKCSYRTPVIRKRVDRSAWIFLSRRIRLGEVEECVYGPDVDVAVSRAGEEVVGGGIDGEGGDLLEMALWSTCQSTGTDLCRC